MVQNLKGMIGVRSDGIRNERISVHKDVDSHESPIRWCGHMKRIRWNV